MENLTREEKILELIEEYKDIVRSTKLEDEIYKWNFIKQFHGRPDPNAEDILEEIKEVNFANLIYHNARGTMIAVARALPEKLATWFKNLYDEEVDLEERIQHAKSSFKKLYNEAEPESSKYPHHQDERSMAAYLTYRYPDRYTFYMAGFYTKYVGHLGEKAKPVGKRYIHYLELADELRGYLLNDPEFQELKKDTALNNWEIEDGDLLFAQDLIYQLFKKRDLMAKRLNALEEANSVRYWLCAVEPGQDKWDRFKSENIIAIGWDQLGDLRKYESKEQIAETLQEMDPSSSQKNNALANYQFAHEIEIGDIVIVKSGRKTLLGWGEVISNYRFNDQKAHYKHEIDVDWKRLGNWRFSGNLAIKTLTEITRYKSEQTDDEFFYERLLGIMEDDADTHVESSTNLIFYGPPGTGKTWTIQNEFVEQYQTSEESISEKKYQEDLLHDKTWFQVIAATIYELKSAKVTDIYEHPWLQIKAGLAKSKNVRATIWGSLQAHTVDDCKYVNYTGRQEPKVFNKSADSIWSFGVTDLEDQIPDVIELMEKLKGYKKEPTKLIKRYRFVTFHQSYSYEDFVEGIKPVMAEDSTESGELAYTIEDGVFKSLCDEARRDPDNRYAIFIDEINRGNVSQIFGELITLIEPDKRENADYALSIILPYSKTSFSVPGNVDIYGTMNTADRSVEALDTALRRRFSFEEVMPDPDKVDTEFDHISLADVLATINERIEILVDRDHTIGHSYFMNVESLDDLVRVFADKIIPLLQEYFYGDYGKIGLVLGSGFVRKVSGRERTPFARFPYEQRDAYVSDSFQLIPPAEENILSALRTLLNQENEAQQEASGTV